MKEKSFDIEPENKKSNSKNRAFLTIFNKSLRFYDKNNDLSYRVSKQNNDKKYIETQRLFSNCLDKKQSFLELVKRRELFGKMNDLEYTYFIKTIPYIIEVQEEDYRKAGLEIDYVEFLCKFKYIKISISNDNNIEKPIASCLSKYKTGENIKHKTPIMDLNNSFIRYDFINLSEGQKMKMFIHELFHLIDDKLVSPNYKHGLAYIEEQGYYINRKLRMLNEGNTERRTLLAAERMKQDGIHLDLKDLYEDELLSYIFSEITINSLIQRYLGIYKAMYGTLDDLIEFEKNNNISFDEEEKRLELLRGIEKDKILCTKKLSSAEGELAISIANEIIAIINKGNDYLPDYDYMKMLLDKLSSFGIVGA